MDSKTVHLLGFSSGIAAGNDGCGEGPLVLKEYLGANMPLSFPVQWGDAVLEPSPEALSHRKDAALGETLLLCDSLASHARDCVQKKQPFITIGGDHSCAIGTWSGAAAALQDQEGPIGLIWIDAHMDAHTPLTSGTGNIHGMPVACLLGHGNKLLTQIKNTSPKIDPKHLCLIGIRSFEEGEAELLNSMGVTIFYSADVKRLGAETVLHEALQIVTQGTKGYGLSIDLDGFTPEDAPAVGTPAKGGVNAQDTINFIKENIRGDSRLIGAEIAEFNPSLDKDDKTLKLIVALMESIYGSGEAEDA